MGELDQKRNFLFWKTEIQEAQRVSALENIGKSIASQLKQTSTFDEGEVLTQEQISELRKLYTERHKILKPGTAVGTAKDPHHFRSKWRIGDEVVKLKSREVFIIVNEDSWHLGWCVRIRQKFPAKNQPALEELIEPNKLKYANES